MGRMYTASFAGVAVTAQQDLISILCTAATPVRLHACFIAQSSDAADAQDEQLRIRIQRGMTSVGSGGGTMTPCDIHNTGTAAVSTARINDTTIASAGTITIVHEDAFNVRGGWVWMPTPEMRPVCVVSTRIAVGLVTTPADSLTMSGTLYFEELV